MTGNDRSKIRILALYTDGAMEVLEIENTLAAMQKMVGGYIEAVQMGKGYVVIANEEGLIQRLRFNLNTAHWPNPLVGDVFVTKAKGEEFASLTDEDLKYLKGEVVKSGEKNQ